MENRGPLDAATIRQLERTRLTLGLLTPQILDTNGIDLWLGVATAAREREVNLICFVGDEPRVPIGFRAQANVLYDMISAERIDGLIAWGSGLSNYIGLEALLRFYERYRPLPIVNVALPLPGIHSVLVNSHQGVRTAMIHLIERHRATRIAFIRGLEDNEEANERYRAYTDTLQEYHIPFDPARVASAGYWHAPFGAKAIETLLAQPGQPLQAVVAACDALAIDAMRALQARGLRVPSDVAVIGFDNIIDGRYTTPPLASVPVQYYQQGYRAVEMLLALVAGESVPEQVIIAGDLVIRQSCGCIDPTVSQAAVGRIRATEHPVETVIATEREAFLTDLARQLTNAPTESAQDWGSRIWEAFLTDVTGATEDAFLPALDEVLCQVTATGGKVEDWQGAISMLRRHTLPILGDADTLVRADDRWQQAQVLIGQTMQRIQAYQALLAELHVQMLRDLEAALITTFDLDQLMQVLADGLPRLGIPGCYLVMYDDPAHVAAGARLLLAYNEQGRNDREYVGQHFPACQLVPHGLLTQMKPSCWVLEPLYFQETQLGFVLFETGPRDGKMYEALRGQISSALQGALLVQRVQQRSAELARKQYILDMFMKSVPDSIYFKDRDSRILQINQALASRFGLQDPNDVVGKTDFDFFPEEQARPKYEGEQEIIRTGQPLLNLEEPDANGQWALTTKMPLRDEHGTIIGTFGISRDITELKKAQQALTQAYSEISLLNTQLQNENVRMSAELDVVRQLQQMILPRPHELTNIPGLEIVGYMQPADEVGGDYYDVLRHDGVLHIGIGDVTGHGLESGVIMLMTQAAIRTLIEHGETDPVKFVTTLNRLIYKNVERIGADKNLTFALVQYQGGQLKLVGQHEELLVVRQNGQVERVDTMDLGFPVGLEPEIGAWVHMATITLHNGEGLVLYTDGVIEAENLAHELYGIDRLCRIVSQHWHAPAEAVKQAVVDDVMRHIGTQKVYDDITLVVLKQSV